MWEKISNATSTELEVYMVSIVIMAFAIGAISDTVVRSIALYILSFGLAIHTWTIYRIYSKR